MATIYIITDGSYSDYHIVTVFSTRELAEKFIALYPDMNDDNIEEYELDKFETQLKDGLLLYNVSMYRDGETRNVDMGTMDNDTDTQKNTMFREWNTVTWFMSCNMFATDEQHAVKIANERRTAFIASGEWDRKVKEWEDRKAAKHSR